MIHVCVGGAPSSGTTLLADLLDAAPGYACPPELYVYCFPEAYGFSKAFREAARDGIKARTAAPYGIDTAFFNTKYLPKVGMTAAQFDEALEMSDTLAEFMDRVGAHLAVLRAKPVEVLVEKTPINANCANLFCDTQDGVYINVVRDGRAVCASLMRRGYSLYEAALIWLYQTQKPTKRPNLLTVRYEDLVADPFMVTAKLTRLIGLPGHPKVIAKGFRTNAYRANIPRIATWSAREYTGKVLSQRPHGLSQDQVSLLEAFELFDIATGKQIASFAKALTRNGYDLESQVGPSVGDLRRCYSEAMASRDTLRQANLRLLLAKVNHADQLPRLVDIDPVLRSRCVMTLKVA